MLPLSSLSLLRGGVQSIAVQLPALASSLSSIGPLVGISPSESDAQPSTSGASTTQASSSRAPLQRQCTSSRGSAWSSPPASARGFSTRAPKQSAPLIQYDSEALALLTPSAIVEKLNRNIVSRGRLAGRDIGRERSRSCACCARRAFSAYRPVSAAAGSGGCLGTRRAVHAHNPIVRACRTLLLCCSPDHARICAASGCAAFKRVRGLYPCSADWPRRRQEGSGRGIPQSLEAPQSAHTHER